MTSKCPGLHCDGCGRKGGAALAVVVVIGGYMLYRWITSPAVARAASEALTIAADTLAALAGLGAVAGLTWAGLAVRRAVRRSRSAKLPAPVPLATYPEPVTLVSSRPVPEIAPRAALSASVSPARAEAARRWARP